MKYTKNTRHNLHPQATVGEWGERSWRKSIQGTGFCRALRVAWETHKPLKAKYGRCLKEDILGKAKHTVEWSGENYTATVPQFLHLKNGEYNIYLSIKMK